MCVFHLSARLENDNSPPELILILVLLIILFSFLKKGDPIIAFRVSGKAFGFIVEALVPRPRACG
jgi:hypothetical protein